MQEKINNDVSITISAVRFPLALLVVYIHSVGDANAHLYDFRLFFSIDFLCFVVPTYFILSGFLFAWDINNDADWYKIKLKKRFHTLLIPYIIWNTITLILDYAKYYKGASSWLDYSNIINWGQILFYGYIDYMPINMPLWYIRDLMVLVLFSPLLYVLIKKFCLFTFVVVAIYYFIDVGPFIIHPVSVMFFLLGMILGMTHTILLLKCRFVAICVFVALTAISIYKFLGWHWALNIYCLTMPFLFIYIISKVICNESIRNGLIELGKFSKFIYFSHYPITLILSIKIISALLPEYSMLNYVVIPILAVIISVVIQITLKKVLAVVKVFYRL